MGIGNWDRKLENLEMGTESGGRGLERGVLMVLLKFATGQNLSGTGWRQGRPTETKIMQNLYEDRDGDMGGGTNLKMGERGQGRGQKLREQRSWGLRFWG